MVLEEEVLLHVEDVASVLLVVLLSQNLHNHLLCLHLIP